MGKRRHDRRIIVALVILGDVVNVEFVSNVVILISHKFKFIFLGDKFFIVLVGDQFILVILGHEFILVIVGNILK